MSLLGKMANGLLKPLGWQLLRSDHFRQQRLRTRVLKGLYMERAGWPKPDPDLLQASGIIFSKDRAMQLHALLASYFEMCHPPAPLRILFSASDDAHFSAYTQVQRLFAHQPVVFQRQRRPDSFRSDLLEILSDLDCRIIFFLVDDQLFIEPVQLGPLLCLDTDRFVVSLRMGATLTKCYMQKCAQPLPLWQAGEEAPDDMLVWRWGQGAYDWGYPLSLDGHLFARREILAMARQIDFMAPNSFEDQLQLFRELFCERFGICNVTSRVVNIPCNRVQQEIDNASGSLSPEELLAAWNRGLCIDHRKLRGMAVESVHQEMAFTFIER